MINILKQIVLKEAEWFPCYEEVDRTAESLREGEISVMVDEEVLLRWRRAMIEFDAAQREMEKSYEKAIREMTISVNLYDDVPQFDTLAEDRGER